MSQILSQIVITFVLKPNVEVTRQAATLAYLQDFRLMMWIMLAAISLIVLLRAPLKRAGESPVAAAID